MAEAQLYPEFAKKLSALLNEYNFDGATNTADFLLAGMVVEQLEAYRKLRAYQEAWSEKF